MNSDNDTKDRSAEDFLKVKFKTQYAINLPQIGGHQLVSIVGEYASLQCSSLQKEVERLKEEKETLIDLVNRAIGCGDHIHQMTITEIRKELSALNPK